MLLFPVFAEAVVEPLNASKPTATLEFVNGVEVSFEYCIAFTPIAVALEPATFEINAEQAGVLTTLVPEGETIKIGDVVCKIDTDATKPEGTAAPETAEKKPAAKEKAADKYIFPLPDLFPC